MKSLTFNKSSWHFLLATRLGGYVPLHKRWEDSDDSDMVGDSADICTYSRHVFYGMLLLAVIGALIAAVGFLFWHVIFGIIFSLLCGCFMFSEWAIAVLILGGAAAFVFGGVAIIKKIGEWRYDRKMKLKNAYRNKPAAPDGFIKNAYKGWKGKFCMRIEFKERK